jgi:hypothetical protein
VLSTPLALMDEFSHRLLAEHHILVREALLETTTVVAAVADSEVREAVKVAVVADQWAVLLPEIGDEARDLTTAAEVEVVSGVEGDVTSGRHSTNTARGLVCCACDREMCKVAPYSRCHAHDCTLPFRPDFQAITEAMVRRVCMTATSARESAGNLEHLQDLLPPPH